eukprot:gene25143-10775_t
MGGALALILSNLLSLVGGISVGVVANRVKRSKDKGPPMKKKKKVARPALVRPSEELKMRAPLPSYFGPKPRGTSNKTRQHCIQDEMLFRQWEHCGQAKIALKVQSDKEMDELAAKADKLGLPTYIVHDAGRTQIPAGSQTVLAIGPAPKSVLDEFAGFSEGAATRDASEGASRGAIVMLV